MQLISVGAAQAVTGSKHILRTSKGTVLIDCGLFQGSKSDNPETLPEILREVDVVILTHGHLDHCGYLPKLVKHGFQGPVFSTPPSLEIAKLIMSDNAKIQANEAQAHNRKQTKESKKIRPLYDLNDVAKTSALMQAKNWNESFEYQGIRFTFKCAGHILGASSVLIECDEKKIVFSGDLGRFHDPVMFDPESFPAADAIVMECTYGNRLHDKNRTPVDDLSQALERVKKSNGTLLIPAFAVARSQNILYYLSKIYHERTDLKLPTFLDSPLSINALKLYERFDQYHRLKPHDFKKIHKDSFFIEFQSQRESLEQREQAKVIVTASGMLTGGLAPHHLKILSKEKKNLLMIAGYQAEGTLGRQIVDGARDFFVDGESVCWSGEVFVSHAFSSHADQAELLKWHSQIANAKKTFLVHGELPALEGMATVLGESAVVVKPGQVYEF